jgi:DNA-binding helix-hairpin-helix protein with protein kinase domain
MANFTDRSGRAIRLGSKLAAGGEGTVYDVLGQPDTVAKIYHKPLTAERAEKIEAMCGLSTAALQRMTAWPSELVLTGNRSAAGLLMPKLQGFKDVHKLYSPKSRKAEFPAANVNFLVQASINIAAAFATVHDAKCVIGDVNHGGVTVADNATVKLIDCDSFQVDARGRMFFCEVGVPTFTPPELQAKPFRGIIRTRNHDNFGLAVLIFHLLFIGRHPFAGRFLGRGDMQIETAIQQFRFAYGSDRQTQMEPPPNVPPLMTVTPAVAALFERAFSRSAANSARPDAVEWIAALTGLSKQLVICKRNRNHAHIANLGACPLCQVETAIGVDLFNIAVFDGTQRQQFDLAAFTRALDSVRLANLPPPLREADLGVVQPSAAALKVAEDQRAEVLLNRWFIFTIVVVTLVLCAALPNAVVLWLICGAAAWGMINQRTGKSATSHFLSDLRSAEARHQAALSRYHQFNVTSGPFHKKKRYLESKRAALLAIPGRRTGQINQLELQRLKQQRDRYLGQYFIDSADIPGIGPGRKATLASYGIETAADIEQSKIQAVPGFGPAMSAKLTGWRTVIERGFVFNPAQQIDPQLIVALDQQLRSEQRSLEQALLSGVTELTQSARQQEQQQTLLRRDLEDCLRAMAQARADHIAVQ